MKPGQRCTYTAHTDDHHEFNQVYADDFERLKREGKPMPTRCAYVEESFEGPIDEKTTDAELLRSLEDDIVEFKPYVRQHLLALASRLDRLDAELTEARNLVEKIRSIAHDNHDYGIRILAENALSHLKPRTSR